MIPMEPASLVMERQMLRGIRAPGGAAPRTLERGPERRTQRPRVLADVTCLPSAIATSSVEITPIGLRA